MYTSTTTVGNAVAGGIIGGAVAGMAMTMAIFAAIFYILVIIAKWKIFVKAGEKGWKSLIPFYSDYILFKLFWETKWFWLYLGCTVVASIVGSIPIENTPSSLLFALLCFALAIMLIVVVVMLFNRMSKSFGHGAGFTFGLLFLSPIFFLILGFNNDKYKKIKD